jgi:hypothetical protein
MRMLAWLLEDQGQRCGLFCHVGMVAFARLHAELLSEMTNIGYPSGGVIFGPDGKAF